MSGPQIATAYVRLRPDATAFKAETAASVKGGLSNIGRLVVPTLAFAGITEGLRKSVQAAELRQVVSGQLEAAVTAAGLNFQQYKGQIDEVIATQGKLGFSEDETARAFALGVRATKNVAGATHLLSLASDVARGRNISLAQATQLLVRVQAGQTGSLRRLGIEVGKHITGQQALARVQQQYAGAAEKYANSAAGSQQRLGVAVEQTQAIIGAAFLPTITKLNTRLADWLSNTDNQRKLQDFVNKTVSEGEHIIHNFVSVLEAVEPPLKSIINLLGGFGNVAEKALVVGLLFKTRQVIAGFEAANKAAQAMNTGIVTASEKSGAAVINAGEEGASSFGLWDRTLIGIGNKLAGITGDTKAATAASVGLADSQKAVMDQLAAKAALIGDQGGIATKAATLVEAAAAREADAYKLAGDQVARKNDLLASQIALAEKAGGTRVLAAGGAAGPPLPSASFSKEAEAVRAGSLAQAAGTEAVVLEGFQKAADQIAETSSEESATSLAETTKNYEKRVEKAVSSYKQIGSAAKKSSTLEVSAARDATAAQSGASAAIEQSTNQMVQGTSKLASANLAAKGAANEAAKSELALAGALRELASATGPAAAGLEKQAAAATSLLVVENGITRQVPLMTEEELALARATEADTVAREANILTLQRQLTLWERLKLAAAGSVFKGAGVMPVPTGAGLAPAETLGGLARGGLRTALGGALRVGLRASEIGLSAYIINSLVSSITGFDMISKLSGAIGSLFERAQSDAQKHFALGAKLVAPPPDIHQARLEMIQAQSAVASDRAAIAAAKNAGEQQKLAQAQAQLAVDLDLSTQKTKAYNDMLDRNSRGLRQVKIGLADAANEARKSHGANDQVVADLKRAHDEAVALGQAAPQSFKAVNAALTEGTHKGQVYASLLANIADQYRANNPLLAHNIDLIAEFANRVGKIPNPIQRQLILNNKNALASLDMVASHWAILRDALERGAFIKLNVGFFGIGVAPLGPPGAQFPGIGNALQNAAAATGKIVANAKEQAILNALAETQGQSGKARITALNNAKAYYDNIANYAKAAAGDLTRSTKQRNFFQDQYRKALGQEAGYDSELQQIADAAAQKQKDAAAKAAEARRKAAAAAKAARAKALRQYEQNLKDREADLARQRTAARAAVMKAIDLGKIRAPEEVPPMFKLPGEDKGLLRTGTLDIAHRKVAHLAGGQIATVKSISFNIADLIKGADKDVRARFAKLAREAPGAEVLLPQVINGRVVSWKKAVEQFQKTGQNLGVFKTVADANRYAVALHDQQAKFYSALGKGAVPPTPGLIKKLQEADQAEVDFYRNLAKTGKTQSIRRDAKNQLQKALATQKADNDAIISAEEQAAKNRSDLALSLAQIAAETGKGTFQQAEAAQERAEAVEQDILTKRIAKEEADAHNRKLGLAKQAKAAAAAATDETTLLQIAKNQYDRKRQHYENLVSLAEADAALAGSNTQKLKAARADEVKAFKEIIKIDQQQVNDSKVGTDDRIQAATKLATDKKRLADFLKGQAQGAGSFSLADFYTAAAEEFRTYGSNIAPGGGPLSPQMNWGDIAAVARAVAPRARSTKTTPIVHQYFFGSVGQQQAFARAKTAAAHLYIGA